MPTDHRPRVLVVEDEPDMNNLLADVLRAFDFEPVQAADGREALDRIEEQPPDAVILDLMLPVIGGYEVCRRLKTSRDTCPIPVLILTALDREPKRRTAYRTGADDYLTKPFAPDALIERLRSCMEQARRATDAPAGQVRLTVEPCGAPENLRAPNALAQALYERTDLPGETVEALRERLLTLVETAGAEACERAASPLVRITMTVDPDRIRVTVDPLGAAAETFLEKHLGPEAETPKALREAGAVDAIQREGGSVVMEKTLGNG
jgi:DNA-binding response OmpR family regulator